METIFLVRLRKIITLSLYIYNNHRNFFYQEKLSSIVSVKIKSYESKRINKNGSIGIESFQQLKVFFSLERSSGDYSTTMSTLPSNPHSLLSIAFFPLLKIGNRGKWVVACLHVRIHSRAHGVVRSKRLRWPSAIP